MYHERALFKNLGNKMSSCEWHICHRSSLLLFMSLSSVEQGQSEQSALLPKQSVDNGHHYSRKKGALLLGLATVVGLSTFFISKGK
jgi:hypothetical protein